MDVDPKATDRCIDHLALRDAKITQIYEGPNQVQRIVMARALLA